MATIVYRHEDGRVEECHVGEADRETAQLETGRAMTLEQTAMHVAGKLYPAGSFEIVKRETNPS